MAPKLFSCHVPRKASTVSRLPPLLLFRAGMALVLMILASAAIRFLPFPWLANRLGRPLGTFALSPLIAPRQIRRARRIGRAVAVAARHAPVRSDCLPQAVVACLLCRLHRIPYALYFGVRPGRDRASGEKAIEAHAWVVAGHVAVAGGPASFEHYTPLQCLVSPHAFPAKSRAMPVIG